MLAHSYFKRYISKQKHCIICDVLELLMHQYGLNTASATLLPHKNNGPFLKMLDLSFPLTASKRFQPQMYQ